MNKIGICQTVTKSVSTEELSQINRFTRREFSSDELYTFSVVLCDNEVDRDGEAFSVGALEQLAKLFIGKTGIFDHNPKGENQTARIFSAQVERDSAKKTAYGTEYHCLKAQAYMLRSEKNSNLILEIEGGIKKEVSVGCSVQKRICSVCGVDLNRESCVHIAGQRYGNTLCFVQLDCAVDAYEWSFVAVPAQVAAGVVKKFDGKGERILNEKSVEQIVKGLGTALSVSASEANKLKAYIGGLEQDAEIGKAYIAKLRQEVVSLSFLANAMIDEHAMQSVVDKMNLPELEAFKKAFDRKLDGESSGSFQLMNKCNNQSDNINDEFKI